MFLHSYSITFIRTNVSLFKCSVTSIVTYHPCLSFIPSATLRDTTHRLSTHQTSLSPISAGFHQFWEPHFQGSTAAVPSILSLQRVGSDNDAAIRLHSEHFYWLAGVLLPLWEDFEAVDARLWVLFP
jgi:hypothetical protein